MVRFLIDAEKNGEAYQFCRERLGYHRGMNLESKWNTYLEKVEGKCLYCFYGVDDAFLVEFKMMFG